MEGKEVNLNKEKTLLGVRKRRKNGLTEAEYPKGRGILSVSSNSILTGLEEIRAVKEALRAELGALKESRKLGIVVSLWGTWLRINKTAFTTCFIACKALFFTC